MADSEAADVSLLYGTGKKRIDAKRHCLTVCIATAAAGLLCTEQLLRKTQLTVPKYWLMHVYVKAKVHNTNNKGLSNQAASVHINYNIYVHKNE